MSSVKLYLDEDVRPLLAEILLSRGYDAVSALQRRRHGLSDQMQLEAAIREGRTFVTHNIRDFTRLHASFASRHYGIVASNQESLSFILRRLLYFLSQETASSVKGGLFWLSNYEPPGDFKRIEISRSSG